MPMKSRDDFDVCEDRRNVRSPSKVIWFEIPVQNFDRAAGFYEMVLRTRLRRESSGPYQVGIFQAKDRVAKGCIIAGDGYRPGHGDGLMVYVKADGRLPQALRRVKKAGGEVVQDTTPLPGNMGSYAIIRDTEGNRVGLHAA